jgi:hypothetical protein
MDWADYLRAFCLWTDCELKRGVSDMRGNRHYVHLVIMIALSFISMYVLMYAMVNRFANVYSNLNQFYMAGLMTAPIVVIELALMRSVYDNKNANIVIIAGDEAGTYGVPRRCLTIAGENNNSRLATPRGNTSVYPGAL